MINPELLPILACPVCEERPPLRLDGEFLICTLHGHGYRIVDGIPHLLPENAISPENMKELLNDRESS